MSPVQSSSIPGAVLALNRAKASTDNPAANVLLSVYGAIPIGTDGQVLAADSTNPLGVSWQAAPIPASLPKVSLRKSAHQSIPNGAQTLVTWDVEQADVGGMHDNVNPSRITLVESGYYCFTATLLYASNGVGTRLTTVVKNGDLAGSRIAVVELPADAVATEFTGVPVTNGDQFVAGDYIDVYSYQSSGGALDVRGTSSQGSTFCAFKVP